ncbi:MAG: OmpA family protein [Rickettsiales bacterium]|nr:OmpA family protein [Rickettsiales bacterium]
MFNRIKATALVATTAAMLATPFAASAFCDSEHNVLVDERGNIVRDARGNCVSVDWMNNGYNCDGVYFTTDERNIYFPFDSARLTTKAKAKLDYIANNILSKGNVTKATLVGYADPIGNPAYNKALSKRRAIATKRYLAAKGYLNTTATTLTGKGETSKFAEGCGGDISCQQPNRRVEIKFQKKN